MRFFLKTGYVKILGRGCDISRPILIGYHNHVTKPNEPIKTLQYNCFVEKLENCFDINNILLNYKFIKKWHCGYTQQKIFVVEISSARANP